MKLLPFPSKYTPVPMINIKANSFAIVNKSWIQVAIRTLKALTKVSKPESKENKIAHLKYLVLFLNILSYFYMCMNPSFSMLSVYVKSYYCSLFPVSFSKRPTSLYPWFLSNAQIFLINPT